MAKHARTAALLILLGIAGASPAAAQVSDWIDRAVGSGYRATVPPTLMSRNVALVAVAMFDAANATAPRFVPYRPHAPAPPGASAEAAAAAAAHYILVRCYPDQAKGLDSALQVSLGAVGDAAARAAGVRLGEAVAAGLWEERKGDGADAPNAYRPPTAPGAYIPTTLPVGSSWGAVRPFVLQSGNQFRPAAPYALTSPQWAADYNEVRRLGAKSGSDRTPEQTEIARFWELTGPATYLPVARHLAAGRRLDALETARAYALAALTANEALVAVFDAKYAYGFWRPVTAIRNGDQDNNPATERNPTWEPFITTPLHPEYPCAHCITQAAVAAVLGAAYGDTLTFGLTSVTAPGVTRRYTKLSDYAAEVINARVYDGVHYRTSGDVGADMGRKIGAYVAERALRPR